MSDNPKKKIIKKKLKNNTETKSEIIETTTESKNMVEVGGMLIPVRQGGEPYHKDPKIRSRQLIYEGRIGGPRPGAGRPRKRRAAELIADAAFERANKIISVLDQALNSNNPKIALAAADRFIDIENKEAQLRMKEDEHDIDTASKEELIAALLKLASDPHAATAIQNASEEVIEIPESGIKEIKSASDSIREADIVKDEGSPTHVKGTRANPGRPSSNGHKPSKKVSKERNNPFKETSRRRPIK